MQAKHPSTMLAAYNICITTTLYDNSLTTTLLVSPCQLSVRFYCVYYDLLFLILFNGCILYRLLFIYITIIVSIIRIVLYGAFEQVLHPGTWRLINYSNKYINT